MKWGYWGGGGRGGSGVNRREKDSNADFDLRSAVRYFALSSTNVS